MHVYMFTDVPHAVVAVADLPLLRLGARLVGRHRGRDALGVHAGVQHAQRALRLVQRAGLGASWGAAAVPRALGAAAAARVREAGDDEHRGLEAEAEAPRGGRLCGGLGRSQDADHLGHAAPEPQR